MADIRPEPVLGFRGRPQPLGLLVELRVQRDHAAVGLLELLGQLAVQGHDAAVRFLQLGVEQDQLLFLLPQILQRGDQVDVLPPELLGRGRRQHRRQLIIDRLHVRLDARRAPLGHPDHLTAGGHLVHQTAGGGDALGRRLTVERRGQQQVGVVDPERNHRGPAGRHRAAADFADRGGHPDLVLGVQGQAGGHPATELTRRVDAGQIPDVQPGEFADHAADHGVSTTTPASQRLLMPSECKITAAPGGTS